MAQFYASIQGNRGSASRLGTKQSGISGHIRGWNVGAQVEINHENGKDVVRVYATNGSAGHLRTLIAEFSEDTFASLSSVTDARRALLYLDQAAQGDSNDTEIAAGREVADVLAAYVGYEAPEDVEELESEDQVRF